MNVAHDLSLTDIQDIQDLRLMTLTSILLRISLVAATVLGWIAGTQPAHAVTVNPYLEDFTLDNAGWANFNATAFATYHSTGGPDGGGYISGLRTLNDQAVNNTAIALRARHDDPWNSSGDAFHGDWIAGGIRRIYAWVRHDIPVPVSFFTRVADEPNFPGHVYVEGDGTNPASWRLVQPNTWTQITFDVSRFSAQLRSSEGGNWNEVFDSVGHVVFGVNVPDGFSTDTTAYTISLDKVLITTPEPASLLLIAGGVGAGVLAGRRTARQRQRTF